MASEKQHTILLLGAGMCVPPLVKYLAEHGFKVILASRTLSKAEKLAKGRPNVEAVQLDIEAADGLQKLEELVPKADGVISMLPYLFHAAAAKVAIAHKKHFFTTSYVSPAIRALEESAKEAGVMLLNECGVDPGFDHMTALRVIHNIKSKGGKLVSFTSITGGLPAPENNDNPFGYKFSWAPRGVLLAGLNASHFLENGKEVSTPAGELFNHYRTEFVPELNGGTEVEVIPNRDSYPYIDAYDIQGVTSMFRGTYRNKGWCPTIRNIIALGLLSTEERSFEGYTFARLLREKIGNKAQESDDIRTALLKAIEPKDDIPSEEVVSKLEWLGVLSDEAIPSNIKTSLDVICFLMQRRLVYGPKEKDMILMRHTFKASYPQQGDSEAYEEEIISTMIDLGIENAQGGIDSSMSRTVALPLAIAIDLLYHGQTAFRPGVWTPIYPELYNPILDALESKENIKMIEKVNRIPKSN